MFCDTTFNAAVLVCMEESALDRIPFRATGQIPKMLCRRTNDRKAHASSLAPFEAENRDFQTGKDGSFCLLRQKVPRLHCLRPSPWLAKNTEFAGFGELVRGLLLWSGNFRGPRSWSTWQQSVR